MIVRPNTVVERTADQDKNRFAGRLYFQSLIVTKFQTDWIREKIRDIKENINTFG